MQKKLSSTINNNNHKSGFVILFAMVISTIILILGSGIFSIAYKEALLSTNTAGALQALYAADAGIECALYLDSAVLPAIHICTAGTGVGYPQAALNATLGTPTIGSPLVDEFRLPLDNNTCTHVTITRTLVTIPTTTVQTKIYAQGYNSCDGEFPKSLDFNNDPNLVERVLEVNY